jgi:hypothetical protein
MLCRPAAKAPGERAPGRLQSSLHEVHTQVLPGAPLGEGGTGRAVCLLDAVSALTRI